MMFDPSGLGITGFQDDQGRWRLTRPDYGGEQADRLAMALGVQVGNAWDDAYIR